jgi:autotransporter-associated beta strand protein
VRTDADLAHVAGRFGSAGVMRKTGNGTLTLYGPSMKPSGAVSIEGGTVVCRPAPSFDGTYFTIKFWAAAQKNVNNWNGLMFSEFSLYGVNGERVNMGTYSYTQLPAAPTQQYGGDGGIDDATALAEREVAVWMPNHDGYFACRGDASPERMFDGNSADGIHMVYYKADSNVLVFRIPDGSPAIAGLTFTTDDYPERRPLQWSLYGSADGVGTEWTWLASNVTNVEDEAAWNHLVATTPSEARTEYDLSILDRLPAASGDYAPFGDAVVSVANGATLDFSSAQMRISRLKVDCDGTGGAITRFTPSEHGTIDLVSASRVTHATAIPLVVQDMATPSALMTWTVMENGKIAPSLGVRWRANRLYLVRRNSTLILR